MIVRTNNEEHSLHENKHSPIETGTDSSPHLEKTVVGETTESSKRIVLIDLTDPVRGKS